MPDWMIYVFALTTALLLGGGLAFTLWQFRRAAVNPRRLKADGAQRGGRAEPRD